MVSLKHYIQQVIIVFSRNFTNRVIYFEGGLGSQIIAFMTLETMIKKQKRPIANFDYFLNSRKSNQTSNWDWELSRYGIEIEQLAKFNNFSHLPGILHRPLVRFRDFSGRARRESEIVAECDIASIVELLPIQETTFEILEKYNRHPNDYGVIHIRKGDYLLLSSRVIELEESLELLSKIELEYLFVICDDPMSDTEIQKVRDMPNLQSFCLLDGNDLDHHALHGIMRLAKVMITSNSTFSWTAGVLNQNPKKLIFSPTHFFNNSEIDAIFLSKSKWMLLN